MDGGGRIQKFDAEAERLFHCRASDVQGLPATVLFSRFPQQLLQQGGAAPLSQTFQLEARPKDGSSLPVALTLTRVILENDPVWVGVICDLSRRHQEEAWLRRSEESYRLVFERAQIGLFQMTAERRLTRVNRELARIYGYDSTESLIAQIAVTPSDLYSHPGRREEFWLLLHKNDCVIDYESEIVSRGGGIVWISERVVAVRDASGALLHYEGAVQDISARKKSENTLRESEQEMRTIFDAAGVGIVRVDMAGRLTRSNPAFQQMLGYTAQELEGMALARLTHPDDSLDNLQQEWDFQEGLCDRYVTEKRYCAADGCTVWADLTFSMVRDEQNKPQFSIAVVENITDKRLALEKNLALNGHLERRVQRIAALHQIDMAIMAGPSMEETLLLVLNQVRAQLGADAAMVLLCNQETQTLEPAAESGLREPLAFRTSQPLGFGFAGQAARDQRMVEVTNIAWMPEVFAHDPLLAAEGFVTYLAVPLIAKGEVKGVLEVFNRKMLTPDKEWREFLDVLAGQAAIAIDSATMFQALQHSNAELMAAYEATIEGWGRALDLRDQETEGHSRRVTDLVERLAHSMNIPEKDLVHIRRGALLHDIGKVGVPDRILLKTDDLTPAEWRIMRRHPQDAYDMLSPIAFLRPALDIPYCHHEKWDGTGYPRGLKGKDIPLAARLFAIVDVWDALRSDRPYRPSWSEARTLDYLRSLSGTHFDPDIVDAFLELMIGKRDSSRVTASESDLLPLPKAA